MNQETVDGATQLGIIGQWADEENRRRQEQADALTQRLKDYGEARRQFNVATPPIAAGVQPMGVRVGPLQWEGSTISSETHHDQLLVATLEVLRVAYEALNQENARLRLQCAELIEKLLANNVQLGQAVTALREELERARGDSTSSSRETLPASPLDGAA